jgi:hypothetical protein
MDDVINLTIALGGFFYLGNLPQWREYTRILTAGKVTAYKRSLAYRHQSLTAFFRYFVDKWNTEKFPLPTPESFGLLQLQPESFSQTAIIDSLLGEDLPEDAEE